MKAGGYPLFILGLFLASEARAVQTVISGLDLVSNRHVEIPLNRESPAQVLVFLSAKCPCSTGHEAKLATLAREFERKGAVFVGIHANADEPREMAHAHFSESRLPFPVIADPQSELADQLGALKTPHAFVFSRGKVVFQGGIDDSQNAASAKYFYLRDALTAVFSGETPVPSQARALGCVIRRP